MLFNSYSFLFYFLIPVLGIFYFISNKITLDTYKVKLWFIITVSILFYAQWDSIHLFLLLGSIVINYYFVKFILKKSIVNLFVIIILNLLPLLYFKYSNFLEFSNHSLVLPLAISFFTFQQIMFIVDTYKGKVKLDTFSEYMFFVLFFPQLIAGPIVHYNDMIGQVKNGAFKNNKIDNNSSNKLQAGFILFTIGLFSKVVIADNLVLESYNSWSDLFSYSFMIYFDFSGYASMAIGLALMFGIVLPINFNSPYKARNLIDFWRRWHITLSNFLKDHVYIPLGGNRYGLKIQVLALIATMVIGGIWHGAGWNFLIWGAFHGLGLALLHLVKGVKLPTIVSVILTFIYVSLLWVLFFSKDFSSAMELYKILFSVDGAGFVEFNYWLIFVGLIVWVMPNATQIIDLKKDDFQIKSWYSYVAGAMMFVSLKMMAQTPSMNFVYFNF